MSVETSKATIGHTPTPWSFETVKTQVGHAHKLTPINACLYVDHRDAAEKDQKTLEAAANINLIVTAVNSHASLVAERDAFMAALSEIGRHANDPDAMRKIARAALALSKAGAEHGN